MRGEGREARGKEREAKRRAASGERVAGGKGVRLKVEHCRLNVAGAKVVRGAGVGAPLGERPQPDRKGISPAERSSLPVCTPFDPKGLKADSGCTVEGRKVVVTR